jgi:hypothetical protein
MGDGCHRNTLSENPTGRGAIANRGATFGRGSLMDWGSYADHISSHKWSLSF